MTRNFLANNQVCSTLDPMIGQKPPGELDRSPSFGSFAGEPVGHGRLDAQRRAGDGSAESSEAASQASTEVQHAEVQAGRSLDGNPSGLGHSGSGAPWLPAPWALRSCLR